MSKSIYLGSDHAGFKLKEKLKVYFDKQNIQYEDLGNLKLEVKDDYPDYGYKVAQAVFKNKAKGILICGSSYGVSIVANKVKGVRAVSISSVKDAKLSREHNDANVLCLSGWNTDFKDAVKISNAFLKTNFSKAVRHNRRVKKIKAIERKTMK